MAAAAKEVGEALEQAFRAEVDALKKEVEDLKTPKEFGQGLYHSTFRLLQAAKREIINLQRRHRAAFKAGGFFG